IMRRPGIIGAARGARPESSHEIRASLRLEGRRLLPSAPVDPLRPPRARSRTPAPLLDIDPSRTRRRRMVRGRCEAIFAFASTVLGALGGLEFRLTPIAERYQILEALDLRLSFGPVLVPANVKLLPYH